MEKLALCAKILYDREVIEGAKKIRSLERKVNGPEPFYESVQAYDDTVDRAIRRLRDAIRTMYDDGFEHEHMIYQGITVRHSARLIEATSECLFAIARDREWADAKTHQIMLGVWGFVRSFMQCGMWENLYMSLAPNQLGTVIFNMIVHQINGPQTGTILENVARFRCSGCGHITAYVEDDNACFDCSQEKNVE